MRAKKTKFQQGSISPTLIEVCSSTGKSAGLYAAPAGSPYWLRSIEVAYDRCFPPGLSAY